MAQAGLKAIISRIRKTALQTSNLAASMVKKRFDLCDMLFAVWHFEGN